MAHKGALTAKSAQVHQEKRVKCKKPGELADGTWETAMAQTYLLKSVPEG